MDVTNASCGGSTETESSVISKDDEQHNNNNNNDVNNSNIEEEVSDESELELGLGLSLGCQNQTYFTAKHKHKHKHKHTDKDIDIDLQSPPSASSSSSSTLAFKPSFSSVGIKRPASPTSLSQVVGWPPIRASRMIIMANQAKSVTNGENNSELNGIKRKDMIYGTNEKGNAKSKERVPAKSSLFVKVNMDGAAIGRKVDLNAHPSYESSARTLEDMFTNGAVEKSSGEELILMPKVTRPSKFLDGSSDYVLTYEDKDGDWMLVGDVPWGMFLKSVKRLRIMRTSEANGLAPRSEERSAKQRSRPI